ncbi:MAG: hypothetical protein BYD32DRAFT_65887 [Podila humilis]|nr:MAG: hypothetical protein BYD32DRAFT_65887 [Podila humilis]
MAHTWKESSILHLKKFLKSQGSAVYFQNRIIKVYLTSNSQADQFVKSLTGIEGGFEASLHIIWNAPRGELMELFQGITHVGVQVSHVRWTFLCKFSPGCFMLSFRATKAIVLYDYLHPSRTYIIASLKDRVTFDLLLRQTVSLSDINWDVLWDDLLDGFNNVRDNGDRPAMVDLVLQYLTLHLSRHRALTRELTGVDVYNPKTHRLEGHLVVNEGIVQGFSFSKVTTAFFLAEVTECSTLRHLELDSYQTDDMLHRWGVIQCWIISNSISKRIMSLVASRQSVKATVRTHTHPS